MRSGLVLFAHGARDPRWAAPFQAVATRLAAARPDVPVRLAFLEFMSPALDAAARELVAEGCTRIVVMPMFLGAGGHVRQDLPRQLDAVRAEHPALAVTLAPAVGEIDAVVEAMAAATLAELDRAATP